MSPVPPTHLRPADPRSVRRLDAAPRVRGEPLYASDLRPPGLLHARVVRSTVPRGRVLAIDCAAALAVPGVVAIVTREDVGRLGPGARGVGGSGVPRAGGLFPEIVNFVGEAVAAVAAETAAAAQEAAELVEVTYEELPAVLTVEAALRPDAPQLAPDGNLIAPPFRREVGDVEQALAEADLVFERTYRTPRQSHATVEPVCAVAQVEGEQVVVRTVSDSPFKHRHEIAEVLGLPEDAVRVISTAGATYGAKNMLIMTLEPVAALLALKTGRPVRLAFSSEEVFRATCTRHPATITVRSGVRRDGTLTALDVRFVLNGGAYGLGERVVESMSSKPFGIYPVPNLRCDGRAVRTNTLPSGAYRGVASVQIFFALETHLNELAAELGLDPLALRRLNQVRSGHRLIGGTIVDATPLERCLTAGAEAFGWDPAPQSERRGSVAVGRGLAISMHHTGRGNIAREGSSARVELLADGRFRVTTPITEKGQGAQTVLAQLAADALGVPLGLIEMRMGDTHDTPYDYIGAEINRATYVAGVAVRQTARTLRAELELLAQESLLGEAVPRDQEALRRLAAWCQRYQTRGLPRAEEKFHPSEPDPRPVFAAHFAEVEVDLETGVIRVVRYVAAQDIGYAVNPDLCRVQTEGGVYHAAALALREQLEIADGQVVNGSFMEYPVGAVGEAIPTQLVLIETPGENPKGIGTSVAPAVAPAIAGAVANAIGRFVRELPLTPERVVAAMEQG